MKATSRRHIPPEVFTPVEITITFETQKELDALYTLSQYCPISDALIKIGLTDPLGQAVYTELSRNKAASFSVEFGNALREYFR